MIMFKDRNPLLVVLTGADHGSPALLNSVYKGLLADISVPIYHLVTIVLTVSDIFSC